MAKYIPETIQKGDLLPPDVQALVDEKAKKHSLKYNARRSPYAGFWFVVLILISAVYIVPILAILMNSVKHKDAISQNAFSLPFGEIKSRRKTTEIFVGMENYENGIKDTGIFKAFGWSLFITVGSVFSIIFFCSMCGWYITRVKSIFTKAMFYLCVFSMIVPFQMVMYSLSDIAHKLHLDTPWGIIVVYLGFGAGLAVFMFCGFAKSIPIEIEEAAMIDGCSPIQTYFLVVMPILKPTAISVAILEAMWIWNDFLLPSIVLSDKSKYGTVPIVIQGMQSSHGTANMGQMMAMLVVAIFPIIVFYIFTQKYIIDGVVAGAVKG